MLIRRIHLYLGLAIAPWMLMYALSTIAMNHRRHLGASPPRFEKERELVYGGSLPAGAPPAAIAAQLLSDLRLDGAFSAGKPGPAGRLVINRADPVTPRRITFTPADGKVVIERLTFRTSAFLERLHRRRGFEQPFAADRIWGATVDLAIAAIVFWALSGVWLWWEMKATRGVGAWIAASGLVLFSLFVALI